ncbi:phage tail protein [Phaeobacter gallaeciensis]|uniref:phage tail protein n=1 Tax=Phaeobacter gallaeciensis TaxID=60890 RepID=UPI00237FAC18|nr:phage tail protein [Phaeobacter gallaeciensis]MDE4059778.1 phage tail protein [Phaeobacter gallaeciensis]MDE4122585.1 phage tail protein [Phaeobacter gallaeciensis]MDE4127266.1 phage tail protein [Phaeobacter gallaeciensis]
MSKITTFASIFLVALFSADVALAGPVAAVFAAIQAFAASSALAAFVVRIGFSLVLTALSRALAPKPGRGRQPGIKTESTTSGGTNPQSFILGTYATAGNMAAVPYSHPNSGGVPNEFLTYVVDVSDLPGVTLSRVMVAGEYVTDLEDTTEGDHALRGMIHDGKAHLFLTWHDGTQTAADAYMVANYAEHPDRPWGADMVGTGVAYAVVTFRYNRKLFNQLPGVRFEVVGVPLYDPRNDETVGGTGGHRWGDASTWEQTSNPAVMIYNILRGITLPDGRRWGGQVAAEDLPLDSWFAAMNECDVEVSLEGGGTEPQYSAGLEVGVDDQPAAVIEELMKACSAEISEFGGVYKLRVGPPALPVYFFNDDDVVADKPQSLAPYPGLDGVHNAIHATHPSPDALWETRDAPPRYNSEWEAEDGGRQLVASVDLPAVASDTQVQRLMKAWIEDERRFRRHSLTLPPDAAVLEPLDCVAWTSAREGYASKVFEVGEVSDDLSTVLQSVAIREREAGDFAWVPGDAVQVEHPSSIVTVPAPRAVFGFILSAYSLVDGGSRARRPGLRLAWDVASISASDVLEWRLQLADGTPVASGNVADPQGGEVIVSAGLLPATDYRAQMRVVSRFGGDWTGWVVAATGSEGLIADDFASQFRPPTVVSALPTSGNWEGRIVVLTTDGRLYRWHNGDWTAEVPAVDVVGQLTSAQIESIDAAKLTGEVVAAQIADGSVNIAKFAAGIQPLEIVSALPSSGNFPGRAAFLTTDGKIYRYTGGQWRTDVSAVDVTGQLTGAQIAAGAISIAKFASGLAAVEIKGSLPATGNFTGRQVMLTSDNKVYRYTGSGWTSAVPAADVTGQITGTQIASGAISTPKLVSNAITASKIAANAVTAGKIAANAVTAGTVAAGAIAADEIAAGAIRSEKLAVGNGQNLLTNTGFWAGASDWTMGGSGHVYNNTDLKIRNPGESWAGLAFPTIYMNQTSGSTEGYTDLKHRPVYAADGNTDGGVPITAGEVYEASAHISTHRCIGELRIQWIDAAGQTVSYAGPVSVPISSGPSGEPDNWQRIAVRGVAPSNAVKAAFHLRKLGTVGGYSDSYMFVHKPQLAQTVPNASEMVPYGPGGVMMVNGGQIITDTIVARHIASNAITAGKIAADAVTAEKIAANAITAGKVAAGAIGADEISAGAVTARNLLLTDFTNIIPNGDFADHDVAKYWSGPNTGGSLGILTGNPGYIETGDASILLQKQAGYLGSSITVVAASYIPIDATRKLYAETAIKTNQAATSAGAYFRLRFYDEQKVEIVGSHHDVVNNRPIPTAWTKYRAVVTPPVNAAFVLVQLYNHSSQTTTNNLFFDRLILRQMNGADLIVDGGITADHITANAITAEKIAAGAVTASEIASNTITSAEIKANAITASELAADAVTADHISANAITAGAIAAGAITSGMAVFSGPLKSDGFSAGSAGWRITKDGEAEFNDILVRSDLKVNSISDGVDDYISGGDQYVNATVATLTLGQSVTPDTVFTCGFHCEYRGMGIYYYTDGEGFPQNGQTHTTLYLDVREKTSGTWGGWSRLFTSGSRTSTSWGQISGAYSRMFNADDVQLRLWAGMNAIGDSPINNVRRIGLVLRSIPRR